MDDRTVLKYAPDQQGSSNLPEGPQNSTELAHGHVDQSQEGGTAIVSARERFFSIQEMVDAIAEAIYSMDSNDEQDGFNGSRRHRDPSLFGSIGVQCIRATTYLKQLRCVSRTFARAGLSPLFRNYFLLDRDAPGVEEVLRLRQFGTTPMSIYVKTLTIRRWEHVEQRTGAEKERADYMKLFRYRRQEDDVYQEDKESKERRWRQEQLAIDLSEAIASFANLRHIGVLQSCPTACTEIINSIFTKQDSIETMRIQTLLRTHTPYQSFSACTLNAMQSLGTLRSLQLIQSPCNWIDPIFLPRSMVTKLACCEIEGTLNFDCWPRPASLPDCEALQTLRLISIGVSGSRLLQVLTRNAKSLRRLQLDDVHLTEGRWSIVFKELSPLLAQLDSLRLSRLGYVPDTGGSCICAHAPNQLEIFQNLNISKDADAWQKLLHNAASRDLARLFPKNTVLQGTDQSKTALTLRILCPGNLRMWEFEGICGNTILRWPSAELCEG